MMHSLYAWTTAHPVEAFALAGAFVALLRALHSVLAQVLMPYPRARAVVEAIAAIAPDLIRFGVMVARAVTGLPLPSPAVDTRDAELAALRSRVAELTAGRVTTAPPPPPNT